MFHDQPHNLEAEQGLIAALLYDNRAYDRITDKLLPHHFFVPAHQRIYAAITERLDRGETASPILLKSRFENDEGLAEVGGAGYLAELAANIVTVYNTPDYASTIKDLHQRRSLIAAAHEITDMARDVSTRNILPETERIITAVTDDKPVKQFTAAQAAADALHWIDDLASGRITPIRTGMKCLDEKISGFYPGRLYVIGARPAMGKTAFALSLANNISSTVPALFISLEMKAQELTMRLLAAYSGISVDRQQNPLVGNLDREDFQALAAAQQKISGLQLEILDAAGMDINTIKTSARRHRRKHGEFVLFVDYLGLMALDGKILNKVHQIEQITTGLKTLSKELNIPIVLLCQLNRGLETREDKTPMPSDLRDSGAIEQDADVIIFIHRPEVYLEVGEPSRKEKENDQQYYARVDEWASNLAHSRGKAEIILAKNRQGRRAKIIMEFDGDRQTFR